MNKYISNKRFLFPIIIMLVFADTLTGQNKIDGYSLNPKLGIYFSGENGGLIAGLETNVIKNQFVYSMDYYNSGEFRFSLDPLPSPNEYFNQLGIMIGKYSEDKFFRLQYQGGLALFWGMRRIDEILTEDFFTIGLVTKLGFKIVPSKYFSIGIDFQANVNTKRSMFMPMISIEIGRLREKVNEP